MSTISHVSASRPDIRDAHRCDRRLALAAVVGPVLFTAAWVVLGRISDGYTLFGTRIAPYSPVHQPISGLGMGDTAVFMNAAFILTGILLVTGVIGALRTTGGPRRTRRTCTVLLSLTGVGVVMDGVFNLEAMMPHSIGFLLAVGMPVVSFLVTGRYLRRLPRWRGFGTWLLVAAPLTLVLVVLFFATFVPTAEGAQQGIAGLVQRVAVTEVLGTFAGLGAFAQRKTTGAPPAPFGPDRPPTG